MRGPINRSRFKLSCSCGCICGRRGWYGQPTPLRPALEARGLCSRLTATSVRREDPRQRSMHALQWDAFREPSTATKRPPGRSCPCQGLARRPRLVRAIAWSTPLRMGLAGREQAGRSPSVCCNRAAAAARRRFQRCDARGPGVSQDEITRPQRPLGRVASAV